MINRPQVTHFVRKHRAGLHFSLEFIFEDIRERLKGSIDFSVVMARRFSTGIVSRIVNVFHAAVNQGQINHVTGDINYVNIFFSTKRTILTILDCGFMNTENRIKKILFKWFWLTLPVLKARYITTISYAAKRDIIRYTGCNTEKIYVIPVAVSEIYQPAYKPFEQSKPVILQVGTAPNKNIERLIQALEGINCLFVVVGKLYDPQVELLKLHKVEYRNYVNLSITELYQQYMNADIVAFVSTSEGFGMPIIEANAVERAVIAGNNTSMPEVGGNAAHYVDAFSIEDIHRGIEYVISNSEYREQLIENGRKNKLRFSSEAIAEMYKALYFRIADELQMIEG